MDRVNNSDAAAAALTPPCAAARVDARGNCHAAPGGPDRPAGLPWCGAHKGHRRAVRGLDARLPRRRCDGPRLRTSPVAEHATSPAPLYVSQLASLASGARAKGGSWGTLDLETRRAALEEAFTKAGVRALPSRPAGQHVIADLMAFYFRSSEANDECYKAMIQREICRPIAVTIRKPDPLR